MNKEVRSFARRLLPMWSPRCAPHCTVQLTGTQSSQVMFNQPLDYPLTNIPKKNHIYICAGAIDSLAQFFLGTYFCIRSQISTRAFQCPPRLPTDGLSRRRIPLPPGGPEVKTTFGRTPAETFQTLSGGGGLKQLSARRRGAFLSCLSGSFRPGKPLDAGAGCPERGAWSALGAGVLFFLPSERA